MASYFMPSFFQKRLLKYALSRLGLVDTEAFNEDNKAASPDKAEWMGKV
jgi:autophagy-related protein 2